jgi:hypothetical protein
VTEYLGWAATVVFVASYFASRAETLRRVQMIGALMWAAYGVLIGSAPVVASNLLVLGAAAWTLARTRSERSQPASYVASAFRGTSVVPLKPDTTI